MKDYELLAGSASTASSASGAKAYERLSGNAAGVAGKGATKGGCGGGGGCGCASKKPVDTGAPNAGSMADGLRILVAEAGRAIQSLPANSSTAGLGKAFQALQAMTDDLLRQADKLPRR